MLKFIYCLFSYVHFIHIYYQQLLNKKEDENKEEKDKEKEKEKEEKEKEEKEKEGEEEKEKIKFVWTNEIRQAMYNFMKLFLHNHYVQYLTA